MRSKFIARKPTKPKQAIDKADKRVGIPQKAVREFVNADKRTAVEPERGMETKVVRANHKRGHLRYG